jgi:hypothetical protein
MSTLATAILAEYDALQELIKLHEDSLHAKAERMKVIEFMRAAAQSPVKLNPTILVLTGLPSLLNSPYTEDADPIPLLRTALRNLSRETTLLIHVDRLEWSPTNRTTVTVDGKTLHVSEIDITGTTTLQTRIKLGTTRGRRKDKFIKVNL